MSSSGMLRRVVVARTDVLEEDSNVIIRATTIFELGTTLAVTSNRQTLRRSTNIPEEGIFHSHRRVDLRSYII
jgi:hypothetical protein